jgi:hypothetical protein
MIWRQTNSWAQQEELKKMHEKGLGTLPGKSYSTRRRNRITNFERQTAVGAAFALEVSELVGKALLSYRGKERNVPRRKRKHFHKSEGISGLFHENPTISPQ